MSERDHLTDCAAVRELIPWAAAVDLSPAEREKVETHTTACAACAALLAFARETALHVRGDPDGHPSAEELARLAEGSTGLTDTRRRELERHLAACGPCRAAVSALRRVDQDLAAADETSPATPSDATETPPSVPETSPSRGSGGRLLSRASRGPRFRWLVPALAGVAVGILLTTARHRLVPPVAPSLLPVTILDDATAAVRGPAGRVETPGLAADRDQALLLEFTSLPAPPAAGDRFHVRIVRIGSDRTAWERAVAGAAFRDNDTLLLSLPAGTLGPGDYRVVVTGPGGRTVYRSRFTVR